MIQINSTFLHESFSEFFSRCRFTILLCTMAVLNLGRMVTLHFYREPLVLDLFGAAIFAFITISLCVRKRTRLLGIILGTPAIGLLVVRSVAQENMPFFLMIVVRIFSALFLGLVIGVIILTLLQGGPTSRDSIAGAFCGYVLIGVMFAEVYSLVDLIDPDSFKSEAIRTPWANETTQNWLQLEYFSFVTLTTVGFGDIVPTTPLTRFLAVWEAICGQFYLAVLVAGLVSLQTSTIGTEQQQPEPDS